MKVFVTYENSFEKPLAENLVAVLKKIGGMLIYGKITNGGVMLEDWANKPKVNMECTAVPIAPSQSASVAQSIRPFSPVGYSAEFQYNPNGNYYTAVMMTPPSPPSMSRDDARGLVAMFDGTANANGTPVKKTKTKVPKPNTTKTGVTIRAIDIDDHEGE